MLGSTKELLNTARIYFDELGYSFHTTDDKDIYERLFDATINTINHTKSFSDTIEAIKMFKYLDKKIDKIVKAAYKYPNYFDSLDYGKNEILSLVSDDESFGIYNITNALFDKWYDVRIFGQSLEDHFSLVYKDSKFSVYQDDSIYFLRYSLVSKEKMVLLNKKGEKLCVIKLNKDLDIELNNNYTDYELSVDDGAVFFYKKGDLQKSEDNYVAAMAWDILDKNSKLGLSRVELYSEEADEELIFLLAASCFLLYRGRIESRNAGLMVAAAAPHIYRH